MPRFAPVTRTVFVAIALLWSRHDEAASVRWRTPRPPDLFVFFLRLVGLGALGVVADLQAVHHRLLLPLLVGGVAGLAELVVLLGVPVDDLELGLYEHHRAEVLGGRRRELLHRV